MRSLLIIAEVALTIIVVIGAALMIESLRHISDVPPGFNPHNVLTAQINLPDSHYGDAARIAAFSDRLDAALASLPGVTAAATTSVLPLSGANFSISFSVVGRPVAPQDEPSGQMRAVSPGYFHALQMKLIRGRGIEVSDRLDSQPVVVVNEALAKQIFPNQDPIGQQLRVGYSISHDPAPPRTIVGIVEDIRSDSLQTEPPQQYYVPSAQLDFSAFALVLRIAGQPALLANAVRMQVQQIDPDLALFNVRTMDEVLASSVSQSSFDTTVLSLFALAALLLASIGVYGVTAYSVRQRTQEIGIRMALGAERGAILKMIFREVLRLALAGVAFGVAGAVLLTRLMAGMLYQVQTVDPLTFAAASILITFVALLAGYLPARRAAQIDPLIALRSE
jgi:putative ABC transport system permease protein